MVKQVYRLTHMDDSSINTFGQLPFAHILFSIKLLIYVLKQILFAVVIPCKEVLLPGVKLLFTIIILNLLHGKLIL